MVRPTLTADHLHLGANDTVLTVTLPGFSGAGAYDILSPEVLDISVPAAALVGGEEADPPLNATPSLLLLPGPTPITLTGGVMPYGLEEMDVRGPSGFTITLQLEQSKDEWVYPINSTQLRQLFARSVRSLQYEPAGWNQIVSAALADAANWITSPTSSFLTVRVPQLAGYSIRAPETIQVTVPSALLVSARARVSTPASFVVLAAAASVVTLDSSVMSQADALSAPTMEAAALRAAAGVVLQLQLQGDTFVPAVGFEESATLALLHSIRPNSSALNASAPNASALFEPYGWDAVVLPALLPEMLYRCGHTTHPIS